MQVSQLIELDTHAVIGGGNVRSFSMSDSAEFFTVLSDTLYRDKKRAVVREVICNGWDAHIMNDCTDRPVEVTLTDDEIIFKDFGPGIADDRIVPIYCVYGASTKVKDAAQTGGFGLGSKAPFAYTDHFTVTSCHEGKKIVYAISRGGTATDGKPEIRQMVAVPTDETGITVTIPLRDRNDQSEFWHIIKSVARQGGMKVKLNGEQIETVDYEPARKQGFCAVYNNGDLGESSVYLLYGTVLYPVSTTDETIMADARNADKLCGAGMRLVLIAPPNSVGVTPSREALSYSELTTNTIKRLLKRAANVLRNAKKKGAKNVIRAHVEKAQRLKLDAHLRTAYGPAVSSIMIDPIEIATHYIGCDPHDRIDHLDRERLVYKFAALRFKDSRRSLRRAFKRSISLDQEAFDYGLRRFTRLAGKLNLLNEAMIYDNHEHSRGNKRLDRLTVGGFEYGTFEPTIFVAPNQRELTSMIVASRDTLYRDKTLNIGFAVGQKPSKELLERISEVSNQFDYEVEMYDFEAEKPKVVRTKRPADKYHSFDAYVSNERMVDPRLDTAKFFMRTYTHDGVMKLPFSGFYARQKLAKLYPGIALITQKVQEEKLRAAGAVNIVEELVGRLSKLTKSREVQYGLMMKDGAFFDRSTHHYKFASLTDTVKRMIQRSTAISKLIFPDRVSIGETWQTASTIIAILRTFEYGNQELPSLKRHPTDVIGDIDARAKETFKHLIVTNCNIEQRLGHLWLLVGSNYVSGYHNYNQQIEDELIGVVRFLQRRGSKSKLNESTNPLKEAA